MKFMAVGVPVVGIMLIGTYVIGTAMEEKVSPFLLGFIRFFGFSFEIVVVSLLSLSGSLWGVTL
jgi:hypothetical protein